MYLTKLKITDFDIPQYRSDNPICLALYRGTYYCGAVEGKEASYQGKVKFDVLGQCYWVWTGEYGRPPVKAGELLQVWLSAWDHGKDVCPITIVFTDDTAEVECEDKDAFLSFWKPTRARYEI